jgi:hypothetical protein
MSNTTIIVPAQEASEIDLWLYSEEDHPQGREMDAQLVLLFRLQKLEKELTEIKYLVSTHWVNHNM